MIKNKSSVKKRNKPLSPVEPHLTQESLNESNNHTSPITDKNAQDTTDPVQTTLTDGIEINVTPDDNSEVAESTNTGAHDIITIDNETPSQIDSDLQSR